MYNLYTKKENQGKITLEKRRDQLLDIEIQTPPNSQAKNSNVILQETLLLSKNQNQASARERAKRMRRNEEEEAYL